jgi:repressor LexA
MELTDRQHQILSYLRETVSARGTVPTVREIMKRFGFSSPATVTGHLDLLEKKGALRREEGRSRNIVLEDAGDSFASLGKGSRHDGSPLVGIPLLGMIPAGIPEGVVQEEGRSLLLDPDAVPCVKGGKSFALEVKGDSMIGAGILEGDQVILEQVAPRNGDIVAALIDGEVTLKRFHIQGGEPFLRAENPLYPDLIPASELIVQGVFRALLRTRPC